MPPKRRFAPTQPAVSVPSVKPENIVSDSSPATAYESREAVATFTAEILSTTTQQDEHGEFAVYQITCMVGARQWTVGHRFSEFWALSQQAQDDSLPPFPKKRYFWRMSAESVQPMRTFLLSCRIAASRLTTCCRNTCMQL